MASGPECGICLYHPVSGHENEGIMIHARSVFRGAAVLFVLLLLASCEGGGEQLGDSTAAGGQLTEGDPAPDFQLPSADDGSVRLSDYRGEKPVLLYFSMGPG